MISKRWIEPSGATSTGTRNALPSIIRFHMIESMNENQDSCAVGRPFQSLPSGSGSSSLPSMVCTGSVATDVASSFIAA